MDGAGHYKHHHNLCFTSSSFDQTNDAHIYGVQEVGIGSEDVCQTTKSQTPQHYFTQVGVATYQPTLESYSDWQL